MEQGGGGSLRVLVEEKTSPDSSCDKVGLNRTVLSAIPEIFTLILGQLEICPS